MELAVIARSMLTCARGEMFSGHLMSISMELRAGKALAFVTDRIDDDAQRISMAEKGLQSGFVSWAEKGPPNLNGCEAAALTPDQSVNEANDDID